MADLGLQTGKAAAAWWQAIKEIIINYPFREEMGTTDV